MEKIILPTASAYHVIKIRDIVFCKSNNSSTRFYLADGEVVTVSVSIKEYEIQLAKYNFFRTHQSYLVNISHITLIDKVNAFKLTMHNGAEIPVSTRKRKELMQLLLEGA